MTKPIIYVVGMAAEHAVFTLARSYPREILVLEPPFEPEPKLEFKHSPPYLEFDRILKMIARLERHARFVRKRRAAKRKRLRRLKRQARRKNRAKR